MKLMIALVVLIAMTPTWASHEINKRAYQPIADVDTRAYRRQSYRFTIVEYDTEEQVSHACNVPRSFFTGRGCTLGFMTRKGELVFKVIVLSNDYVALKHELEHIIHGPCHINAGGKTPISCQKWLIKNNLDPIGNERITILKIEDKEKK